MRASSSRSLACGVTVGGSDSEATPGLLIGALSNESVDLMSSVPVMADETSKCRD